MLFGRRAGGRVNTLLGLAVPPLGHSGARATRRFKEAFCFWGNVPGNRIADR